MSSLLIGLQIAWLNLREHRRRTLLLASAIASVTSLLVLLTSLSVGIDRTLIDSAVTLSAGHVNVAGFFKVNQGQAIPLLSDYQRVSEVVRRTVPEMEFMVARGRGGVKINAENASISALLNGIDLASEAALRGMLQITSGNIDDLRRPNTLLLFEQQAKTLSLKVGDAVTLSAETTRGVNNTLDCQVVAIAHDVGLLSSMNVFVSSESLRSLFQLRPEVSGVLQLHLKASAVGEIGPIASRLRSELSKAGYSVMKADPRAFFEKLDVVTRQSWSGQKLDVTSWQDEVSFLTWTTRALRGMTGVLIGVLLGVTVAGITNSMWVAVRERTREIGTLRAIGMQRASVARLFLMEAGLLGLLGSLSGGALGVLLTFVINAISLHVPLSVQLFLMRDTLRLALEPSTLITAVGLLTLTACLAAIYPALRAAARRPVDAMSHAG
jgi:ABC-type lipoprotein release transport system permease subunit